MSIDAIEAVLRAQLEPIQYVAFFGLFFLFALLENIAPRDASAPARLWRWPANVLLTALNVALMGAMPVGLIAAADYARANGLGLANMVEMPFWAAFAVGFLGRAFLSWGTHFLNHKVPFLWAVHRVHHVDTRLDVSTTVRFHPLETVFTTPLVLGGVVAFGVPPVALLIYEILDASVTVFSHANVRVPWWIDRPLSLFIVTPDLHRVHHSSYQPETDSNFGAVLTIWDRLLGTYRRKPADETAVQENGLSEVQDSRSNNPVWLLILPFIGLRARAVRHAKGRS